MVIIYFSRFQGILNTQQLPKKFRMEGEVHDPFYSCLVSVSGNPLKSKPDIDMICALEREFKFQEISKME